MSGTSRVIAKNGSGETEIESGLIAALSDRRKFVRANTAIRGKVLVAGAVDHQSCVVVDISLDGTLVECADAPPVGTEVVLSAKGFDHVAGVVVRETCDGMAISFQDVADARAKMIASLLSFLSGEERATGRRRHERVKVPQVRQFTRPGGEMVDFEFVNLSLSGASLTTRVMPPVGEILAIGNSCGRVTRHLENGITVEFGLQE